MSEYYIGQYRDHYAIFDSMGRVQTQYDTHAEAKADLDSYNKTGKPLPEAASKDSAIDKAFKGPVNSMFDTTSKEFKKVGNDVGNDESMNEGIFTAINIGFWGFIGICCIISGILDKKHGKEVKTNLTDVEFKAIKNDTIAVAKSLIAAQKSSPFYNNIYKYNRITQDSYKDMIDNFNKGNLYSCTVRFFDAENFENYKSYYNEYGEWGNINPNWEKLEKSVNADMVKIIESLGFDIKTGKSSKYPNCEVRVADGEVVYVYPKAPDDILERGKKSKKKLNEDHSEISNDPEIEKLLALAGCTVEDLDTINNEEDIELDDDDPIDANTSREIDAVMDESFLGIKSKKEKNAKEVTKAEFDKLINDMVSINDAIISKLKTSKWWKSIFEPCYNSRYYKTPNIHEEASNYKREFSAGKCVAPSFSSKFTNINSSDPEVYINLDDPKNIDLSNPDSILDNGYRESKKIIEETIKKLGFIDGKSDRYPNIKVSISQGAYISFDISPIYTGCYKLKDTKNSQNESVNDLDFIMESIFMDIDH